MGNNGNVVTLRLADMDDEANLGGEDYYVGFNLRVGINVGSIGGTNRVLVFRKRFGGPTKYGESDRIADIYPGQSYTIRQFKGTSWDVIIRTKAINNNGWAPIEITTVEGVPVTLPPTSTPDPAFENLGTGYCRDSTGQYSANWDSINFCVDLPTCQTQCKNQNQCVGVAWSYKPLNNYDGCTSQSKQRCVMYYSLGAPGVVVEQASGVHAGLIAYRYLPFNSPQTPAPVPQSPSPATPTPAPISPTTAPVVLITDVPTTPEPTPEPTVSDAPTENPTKSCANRQGYLWKDKDRRTCQWAGKGSTFMKKQKKCQKRDNINGNNVAFHCRKTCAKVGIGCHVKRVMNNHTNKIHHHR